MAELTSSDTGPKRVGDADTLTVGPPTEWTFWTMSDRLGTAEEMTDAAAALANEPGPQTVPLRELPRSARYRALGQFGVDVEYCKAYGLAADFAVSLRTGEKTLTIEIQDSV